MIANDKLLRSRGVPRLLAGLAAALLVLSACADPEADPVVDDPLVDPVAAVDTAAVVGVADTSAAAAEFSRWLTTAVEPGREHEYTANGLRRLADVIDARMMTTDTAGPQTGELRQTADAIQRDPTAATHAERVRAAFATAATVISDLSGQAGDNALTSAANAIDANRPLLEQMDAVRRFFETARDAL